jgi:hypothetical protein
LRLIGQAVPKHVEGIDPMLAGEGSNIFLPFQNRATDSRQKNNGGAGVSCLPKARPERADLNVSVIMQFSHGFSLGARFDPSRSNRCLQIFLPPTWAYRG